MRDKGKGKGERGVTFRSVFIGLAFVPINIYLVVQWETVWRTQYPTTMGIFFSAIFCLLIITLLNLSLKKFLPKRALSQGELLTIYVILMMAISASGHDFSQGVFGAPTAARWFATPENEWASLFWKYLPDWLNISDEKVMRGFHEGETTFYKLIYIKPVKKM